VGFAQQPSDSIKEKVDGYTISEMYVFNEQEGGVVELGENFFSQLFMLRIRLEEKNIAYYSINIRGEENRPIAFAAVNPIECNKAPTDDRASEIICYEGDVISNLLKDQKGYGVVFEQIKLPPNAQVKDIEYVSFTFLFEPRNYIQVIGYKIDSN
jgi:hypothetical protein